MRILVNSKYINLLLCGTYDVYFRMIRDSDPNLIIFFAISDALSSLNVVTFTILCQKLAETVSGCEIWTGLLKLWLQVPILYPEKNGLKIDIFIWKTVLISHWIFFVSYSPTVRFGKWTEPIRWDSLSTLQPDVAGW